MSADDTDGLSKLCKAGVVCLQVKLCDPHVIALEVRFSRRGLVEGLAWWDWPLTWWTDQLLSFSA